MKSIFLSIILFITLFASSQNITQKKEHFFQLLVPAVQKVHKELMTQYKKISNDIKSGKNRTEIDKLKLSYRVKSDKELLLALKPHPQSIVLAQAAIESSWATSRFFRQANNVFGVHSTNKNEPRMVAGKAKNVWLKKFNTIEDSVRNYYKVLAIGRAFKGFREIRMKTDNVHNIVLKLDRYSEIGHQYAIRLSQIIRFNKLKKYDN